MFEYYSFGDYQLMAQALNGLAAITSSNGFNDLLRIGFLVGVLLVAAKHIATQKFEAHVLFSGFLIYSLLFSPKVDILVHDVYSSRTIPVANVPVGIAGPMSVISYLGLYFSETFETVFTIPTNSSFIGNGYMDSLTVLLKIRDLDTGWANSAVDATGDIQKTIEAYIVDCVVYDIELADVNQEVSWETLRKAPDVWAAMKTSFLNKDTRTFFPADGPDGNQLPCVDAYTSISTYLASADFTTNWDNYIRGMLGNPHASTMSAAEKVQNALEAIQLDSSRNQTFMLNSWLRNSLENGNALFSATGGDMSSTLIKTTAIDQRNVQWAAEKSMFESIMRPFTSFIEVFVAAAGPLMAFIIVAFGNMGVSLAVKYLLLVAWVALWSPTLTLCNLFLHKKVIDYMENFVAYSGLDPLSIGGMGPLYQELQNSVAMGGMLAASTPILTLLLIYGSAYTATSLAGKLQGGDHVNEKIAAPDVTNPAPMVAQTPQFSGDAYHGFSRSGSSIPTMHKSEAFLAAQQAAQGVRDTAQQSFATNYGRTIGFGEQGSRGMTYNESTGWENRSSNSEGFRATAGYVHNSDQAKQYSGAKRMVYEANATQAVITSMGGSISTPDLKSMARGIMGDKDIASSISPEQSKRISALQARVDQGDQSAAPLLQKELSSVGDSLSKSAKGGDKASSTKLGKFLKFLPDIELSADSKLQMQKGLRDSGAFSADEAKTATETLSNSLRTDKTRSAELMESVGKHKQWAEDKGIRVTATDQENLAASRSSADLIASEKSYQQVSTMSAGVSRDQQWNPLQLFSDFKAATGSDYANRANEIYAGAYNEDANRQQVNLNAIKSTPGFQAATASLGESDKDVAAKLWNSAQGYSGVAGAVVANIAGVGQKDGRGFSSGPTNADALADLENGRELLGSAPKHGEATAGAASRMMPGATLQTPDYTNLQDRTDGLLAESKGSGNKVAEMNKNSTPQVIAAHHDEKRAEAQAWSAGQDSKVGDSAKARAADTKAYAQMLRQYGKENGVGLATKSADEIDKHSDGLITRGIAQSLDSTVGNGVGVVSDKMGKISLGAHRAGVDKDAINTLYDPKNTEYSSYDRWMIANQVVRDHQGEHIDQPKMVDIMQTYLDEHGSSALPPKNAIPDVPDSPLVRRGKP